MGCAENPPLSARILYPPYFHLLPSSKTGGLLFRLISSRRCVRSLEFLPEESRNVSVPSHVCTGQSLWKLTLPVCQKMSFPFRPVLLILKFVASRAEMLLSVVMPAGIWPAHVCLRLCRAVKLISLIHS
jgi:hypothetical protein